MKKWPNKSTEHDAGHKTKIATIPIYCDKNTKSSFPCTSRSVLTKLVHLSIFFRRGGGGGGGGGAEGIPSGN